MLIGPTPMRRRAQRLAARACAAFFSGWAALACSPTKPVPTLDLTTKLPDVAAEYRADTVDAAHTHHAPHHFRIWRSADRLEIEQLEARTGERWQRDGAVLFVTKLFHADKRGILFRDHETEALGAPDFRTRAILVDPKLIAQLTETDCGWEGDAPYRRYRGEVKGMSWDITMRVDLALPRAIGYRQGARHERIELEAGFPLERAPWTPTPSGAYELIDFADLGDRASDPFVMKVERQLGVRHSH